MPNEQGKLGLTLGNACDSGSDVRSARGEVGSGVGEVLASAIEKDSGLLETLGLGAHWIAGEFAELGWGQQFRDKQTGYRRDLHNRWRWLAGRRRWRSRRILRLLTRRRLAAPAARSHKKNKLPGQELCGGKS